MRDAADRPSTKDEALRFLVEGEELAYEGRIDEAAAAYAAAEDAGGGVRALVGRGVCALLGERHAMALAHFRDAVAREPDELRAHLGLGLARMGLGYLKAAQDAFLACLERDPDHAGALSQLVRVAFARGEHAAAEGYLAGHLARHPEADDFRFALAGLQLLSGRARAAARTLSELSARRPDFPGMEELAERVAARCRADGSSALGERFVVTVIPARGGSKGIPRKNLQPVAGKPLLWYTIEAARAARFVEVVAVTTEDAEIARAALTAGAEVVQRPAELATDEAPTEPALLHCVQEIERRHGRPADIVLLCQATSPLRPAAAIDAAVRTMIETGCDSVVAVTPDLGAHFAGRIENGRFVPPYDPRRRRRRQDLVPLYRETGALYAVRRETLFAESCRMGGDMRPLVLGEEEAIDIDRPEDLAAVEAIIERRRRLRAI